MEIASSMSASFQASTPPTQVNQSRPEASEPISGPDNDSDRDDQIAVQSTNSTPAVNAMGQTIGQLIDVSA
jgi:hypothetical protein